MMKFSEINASQIYFSLKDILGFESFFPTLGGSWICKKKPMRNVFFNF